MQNIAVYFAVLLIVLATCSSHALIIYVICYFGREDHFLQFVSHFCYWPTVMSVQIILIVALWVNHSVDGVKEMSWTNVFRLCNHVCTPRNEAERSLRSRFNRICIWMIYIGLPAGHAILKIVYSTQLLYECPNMRQDFWIFIEILGVFFFSTFCYFLSFSTDALQRSRRKAKKYVRDNKGDLELCMEEARKLFQEYYQLQTFLVPWLYLTVLSSMFGIGVCINWNYNKVKVFVSTMQPYQDKKITFCTYICDSRDFMREDSVLLRYNLWVSGDI